MQLISTSINKANNLKPAEPRAAGVPKELWDRVMKNKALIFEQVSQFFAMEGIHEIGEE